MNPDHLPVLGLSMVIGLQLALTFGIYYLTHTMWMSVIGSALITMSLLIYVFGITIFPHKRQL